MTKDIHECQYALSQLPNLNYPESVSNGEALDTDEAAIWKRVLDYRIAKWQQPDKVLEFYAGVGISTQLFKFAAPRAVAHACTTDWATELPPDGKFNIIDIDPYGQPWAALDRVEKYICPNTILMVTNGGALAVSRNFQQALKYPTANVGRKLPVWVVKEYLPLLEKITNMEVQFFYAFPTSVRAILSNQKMPGFLFEDCPIWMGWLKKYAVQFLGATLKTRPGAIEQLSLF